MYNVIIHLNYLSCIQINLLIVFIVVMFSMNSSLYIYIYIYIRAVNRLKYYIAINRMIVMS